jgi:hypothetical protein
MKTRKSWRSDSGQSLLETVLIIPLLVLILLNAVNFGYFFLMTLNLSAASRTSTLYAIMGSAAPPSTSFPPAGPVTAPLSASYLVYQDLTGSVSDPTGSASVQICSPSVGISNAGSTSETSACTSFPAGTTFPPPDADPELNAGNTAPAFILQRVDVKYSFTPPIPSFPFNLLVLITPACSSTGGSVSCTFYRHAEMRGM